MEAIYPTEKTLPPDEYQALTQEHMNQALSKTEFTRRYGVYKILVNYQAIGYYIGGEFQTYVTISTYTVANLNPMIPI